MVNNGGNMVISVPVERWTGKVCEVVIGATREEGGSRGNKLILGGESTLPMLAFEGNVTVPKLGLEVLDIVPDFFPERIKNDFPQCTKGAREWAKACKEAGAEMICLKLVGTNPEEENRSVEESVETVMDVLKGVDLPLFVYGCGAEEKDGKVLSACAEAAKGERIALGLVEQDKYKTIAAAAIANGHAIVGLSNIDVNLAKQLNILLMDFGMKKESIIMDPLTGGVGYGLEYTYSVMERIRLAALSGDVSLQMPMISDVTVSWNAQEAVIEKAEFGDAKGRGVLWEATTAIATINAGADLVIARHPSTIKYLRSVISNMYAKMDLRGAK